MEISLLQGLLITLAVMVIALDNELEGFFIFRPIIVCPVVGAILGDLQIGLAAGALVELAFAGKSFVKSLIKDLPEMILDLDKAFETFNEVDSKYENIKDFVKEETVEAYKEYTTSEEACDFVNISLRDLLNGF